MKQVDTLMLALLQISYNQQKQALHFEMPVFLLVNGIYIVMKVSVKD